MSPFSGSIKTAAQRGWYPLSGNFCPRTTVASHWKVYCDGCGDVGRKPDGADWRVARTVLVAPTDQEAEDLRALIGMDDEAFGRFLDERRAELPGFILRGLRP